MKKTILMMACSTLLMTACDGFSTKQNAKDAKIDSLMQIVNQKDDEVNNLIQSINEVQEGFQRINEAEGRITIANGNPESASATQQIRENMDFIQQAMQQNREQLALLEEKLKNSSGNLNALRKTVANLQAQMEEKTHQIQELQAQLAEKDTLIALQGDQIDVLNENVEQLNKENREKAETVQKQTAELNQAWFVFGTKAELKEQKILKNGEVLKSEDFNKKYFTEVDIRTMREIRLYSKKAELLTSHPDGSYKLVKDNNNDYILRITNTKTFWSVSKFLVILVK